MRFALLIFLFSLNAFATAPDAKDSAFLLEEPMSQSTRSHAFDWIAGGLEVEAAYGSVNEANNYLSWLYHFGVSYPVGKSILLRGAVRSVSVAGTASSENLARTPYMQAAQPERKEIMLGVGYPLLAGRSFSRLSPWLSDLDHVLFLQGGLRYAFFPTNESFLNTETPRPLPGQRVVAYTFAGEVGLRFKVGLPRSLGVFMEWTAATALKGRDADIPYWSIFMGGLTWNFGG